MDKPTFDVIVVGSGITGGWAAKEFCEKGFKTLLLERGPPVEHGKYPTERDSPWNMPFRGTGDSLQYSKNYAGHAGAISGLTEYAEPFYVNDVDEPYQLAPDTDFRWVRGYQLGGKSLIWGRHTPRFAPLDFDANSRDGHGSAWPIRYDELAKWYDYVEDFIGVSGQAEGLPHYPDGRYLPPFELTAVEKCLKQSVESIDPTRRLTIGRTANLTRAHHGRSPCMSRLHCQRGCSLGAYFSTQSSTLPAAQATGNLTVLTDTIVESLAYDASRRRVSEVHVIHAKSRARQRFSARTVFVCASTFNSVHLMLNSRSETQVNGLGGNSGVLGKYILDHVMGSYVEATTDRFGDTYTSGNRPTPFVIPRFANLASSSNNFRRGYFFWGQSYRLGWSRGIFSPGVGEGFKASLGKPGPWMISMNTCGEMLPRAENMLTLDERQVDRHGIPQLKISFRFSDNEQSMMNDAESEGLRMMRAAGFRILSSGATVLSGGRLHEMGGARMGADPNQSVLNSHNQCHDARNVFVTDGAALPSGSCYNPSLTYMALTARACDFAAIQMKAGTL
jgi:choline dehydrogenase-like flavoprotein